MKKLSLIFGAIALLVGATSAQETYPVKIKVEGLNVGDSIYLANYFGDKLYYNDTTTVQKGGMIVFDGKPYDEGGKYAVVMPGQKIFDVLLDTEPIELHTNASDYTGKLEVKQSVNNGLQLEYVRFINDRLKERKPLEAILGNDSTATEKEQTKARKEFEALNNKVQDYQKQMVAEHGNTLFGKFLNMTMDVEVPDAPADVEDERVWKYYYYKDHFWDKTDLKDPRLMRDQMIQKLLEKYFKSVLPQDPDSIFDNAVKLIAKTEGNKEMRKYIIHYVTYMSETSKVMCMDKAFVNMVDKYYKTGQAEWLDDEKLNKVLESAEKKRNVVCNKLFPNIILPDEGQKDWKSIYDIDAKYTAVVVWESTCGHCKKELPILEEIYAEWKEKGLEVYAIGNDFEPEPWQKYIKEKDYKWINVSDNPEINNADSAAVLIRMGITTLESLNFRKTLDIFSTPKVFLLDKDKKIVAKQIGMDQLEDLLKHLEGIKDEESIEEPEK